MAQGGDISQRREVSEAQRPQPLTARQRPEVRQRPLPLRPLLAARAEVQRTQRSAPLQPLWRVGEGQRAVNAVTFVAVIAAAVATTTATATVAAAPAALCGRDIVSGRGLNRGDDVTLRGIVESRPRAVAESLPPLQLVLRNTPQPPESRTRGRFSRDRARSWPQMRPPKREVAVTAGRCRTMPP